MNDEKIRELLCARDEGAIAEIERKYGDGLRRLSESVTRDKRDAEECVNDAYLALWRTVPDNVPEMLHAYLTGTVKNLSYKRVRSKTAAKRSGVVYELSEYGLGIADTREPWNEIDAAALREAINDFYDSLPEENRVIFVRRYLYHDPYVMIGHRLGISEKNVSVRLTRMKEKMGKYLTELGMIDMREYEKPKICKPETYIKGGVKCVFTPYPEYRHIDHFCEGLAIALRHDGMFGFIDTDGAVRIPFEYSDGTTSFSEGLAGVINDEGKLGFIDRDGKCVIPFEYEGNDFGVNYFEGGIARVKLDGKYVCINKENEIVYRGESHGFTTRDGDLIVSVEDTGGRDIGLYGVVRGEKLGYINRDGETVVPFEYDYIPDRVVHFSEGVSPVSKDGVWGIVDDHGNVIVEPTMEYNRIDAFVNGIAMVTRGKPEALPMLPGESELEHMMRQAQEWNRKACYGFIDKTGREVIPAVYKEPKYLVGDEYRWLLRKDGEYFAVRPEGSMKQIFVGAEIFWDDIMSDAGGPGMLAVKKGKKWGAIDFDGNVVIQPEYSEVVYNGEGFFEIMAENRKRSICEAHGEPILPFEFDYIGYIECGVTTAEKDGVFGILRIEK